MKRKNKIIIAVFCMVLILAFAFGATGKIKLENNNATRKNKPFYTVGFIITEKSLFSMGIKGDEHGRCYARYDGYSDNPSSDIEYVFDDFECIRSFTCMHEGCLHSVIDKGINESHITYGLASDSVSIEIEGVINMVPDYGEEFFYINNVYQTVDGEVFIIVDGETPVTRFSSKDTNIPRKDISFSRSFSSEYSINNKKYAYKGNIKFEPMDIVTNVSIIEYNDNDELVNRNDLKPEDIPDTFSPYKETSYILVENTTDKGITRQMYQKSDKYIRTYHLMKNGFLAGKDTEIIWIK